jgi:predicted phage terminase large subunit-like protein
VRFFTIDLAITTNANSDYTVISYFASDKNNNIYLIDCYREKIEGAQHADIVNMMYQKYKPHAVGVESVAYQQSLCQTLIRMGLPVVLLKPDKDKTTRAWSAAIRHENGAIYFNRHLSNLNDLESELGMFPNSKHDDFVDTLSYAVEYMQSNEVSTYASVSSDVLKQAYKKRKPTSSFLF